MTEKILNKILVVEDNEDIRNLIKLTLTELGSYRVETASNGFAALDMMQIWPPELIVMDVKMPFLDGPSTLIRMKQKENLKNIPVVFITGLSMTIELECLLKIGGLAYLLKPFDPVELCDQIEKIWKEL